MKFTDEGVFSCGGVFRPYTPEERERRVHMLHCEDGVCKYGEDDTCPVVAEYSAKPKE